MKIGIKLSIIALAIAAIIAPIKLINAQYNAAEGSEQKVLVSNSGDNSGSTVPLKNHNMDGAVVLYVGSTQALVNNVEKQVDSDSDDAKPYIKDERTLVPVRFIAEGFGAKVNWDEKTSTVNISVNGRNIKMVIGKTAMTVDGKSVSLDVPPEITGGRTYIPLRKFAEAIGKEVFYDRGLIIIGSKANMYDISTEKSEIDSIIARVNNLPVVGSFEKLKSIIKVSENNNIQKYKRIEFSLDMSDMNMAPAAAEQSSAQSAKAVSNDDYSTTNIQVEGVDEADIVKTDGEYIYQVNKGKIVVVKAYPEEEMKVVSSISFADETASPIELYIDKKYMTVVASNYSDIVYSSYSDFRPNSDGTKVIVYDISDRKNIKKVREFGVDGSYVSSRKIGSSVYLISNKYIYSYGVIDDKNIAPCYTDSAVKEENVRVEYTDIRYFPGSAGNNFMVISSINLDKMDEPAKVETYLGAGQNIYCSLDNLYVSITGYTGTDYSGDINELAKAKSRIISNRANEITKVYKFSLNNGQITYLKEGSVPGRILNQFSMDEYNGYFRIATTVGSEVSGTSKNNVYILDDILNIKGKIENIAPGEKIYSTRFMGDRCYMVTFKKVDPLFVIDLKDPASPKILGALKIPGYSDYLHPYDENHIIGFGKDTEVYEDTAYYQGMKIALFDVSDVNNPVQKFQEIIGDRGTDSELLRNHKALLFSKEKNLMAFPVDEKRIQDKNNNNMKAVTQQGYAYFQGAYVYNIDLVKGFTLKGKITHMNDEDALKSGQYSFKSNKSVQRILYIGDTLYTLSNSMIKANDINDLKEKKSVLID